MSAIDTSKPVYLHGQERGWLVGMDITGRVLFEDEKGHREWIPASCFTQKPEPRN